MGENSKRESARCGRNARAVVAKMRMRLEEARGKQGYLKRKCGNGQGGERELLKDYRGELKGEEPAEGGGTELANCVYGNSSKYG
jgi:hypothetical protein